MIAIRILAELQASSQLILYFESTVIHDSSFRTKCWYTGAPKNTIRANGQTKSLKLLMVVSQPQFVSMRILQKCLTTKMREFIAQSVNYALKSTKHSQAWLLIDNAKVHRSADFLSLADELNVRMPFNAVVSPRYNLAECYFEYVKRDLRKEFEIRLYQIIQSIIGRTRDLASEEVAMLQSQQHQAFQLDINEYLSRVNGTGSNGFSRH